MNVDRALFLSLTVAIGAATTGCSSSAADDAVESSTTEQAATSDDCAAGSTRPAGIDERTQGFRLPAPIAEGWADEVPLARYYEAVHGRYTTTWAAAPYRELVLSGRPVVFAPSGRRAFELRGIDASGRRTVGAWWIEYVDGDRSEILVRAYDPAQVSKDDDECFSVHPVRRSTCYRGSLLPAFYLRPSPVLPTPSVTLPYGYTRAPCLASPPPTPAWNTCGGGFAVRTDVDPAVFWLRLPDGTTTKVRRATE